MHEILSLEPGSFCKLSTMFPFRLFFYCFSSSQAEHSDSSLRSLVKAVSTQAECHFPSFLHPPSFQPSSTKPFCSLNEELDSSWALGPLWLLTKYLAKCLFHIHEKNNMSISFSVFLTPHPPQQMGLLCVQSILVISHHLPSTIWRLLSYHFILQTLWSSKL